MSILENNSNPNPVPRANIVAERIKHEARATFRHMVRSFNEGSKMFWDNNTASPGEIAEALGSDAKEVFELHGKLGSLLGSVKPEAIAEGASLVGDFTMNDDGTVTVIVPESTPED